MQDYEAFVKATGRAWSKSSFSQGPTHAAAMVSWEDARAFCDWLTKKELAEGKLRPDQSYRLPTDAEWSLAVGLPAETGATPRDKDGKIKGVYPWGTQSTPPKGAGNYWSSLGVDEFADIAPVGQFAPNRFGLYDLGGNLWEWCEDEFSPGSGTRVLRGASWGNYEPGALLSSFRNYCAPGDRSDLIGFRVVLAGVSVR